VQLALGLMSLVRSGGTAPAARSRSRPRPGPAESPSGTGTRRAVAYLAALLSGVAVSLAWWFPETVASALLGWVAAVSLVFAARARRGYLPAYCCGLVLCALGFYWIFPTVALFGGFGAVPAALVFGLFVALSAVQFLVFAFFHNHLGPRFDALALRSPVAIVLSELASVRLFHWHYGHTQVAFTPFVQVADVGGAMLVTFLMFWVAEAGVRALAFGERRRAFLVPLAAFGLSLAYGAAMIRTYSSPRGERQEVVLVQGNSDVYEHFDPETVRRDINRLYELSRRATRASANALIVWAEGAIPAPVPPDLGSVRREPVLPCLDDGSAFLVGAYAADERERRYNAAFAVAPDGSVPLPYYKQILIPFGEYMPLASVLPWLNGLNAKAGAFTAGTEVRVFDYPMRRADGTAYALKVAPLICYEDTVPALSRAATRKGAELLVNLTYDTWFGRSVAPAEHHLIAAFRAIENRRYLVRATNSGLSGVVDPLGRTVARLPEFAEGTASATVVLLKDRTLHTDYVRERPWWALLAASLGTIIVRSWRRRARESTAA
jgi:apolipoprotein N-acyltransferase